MHRIGLEILKRAQNSAPKVLRRPNASARLRHNRKIDRGGPLEEGSGLRASASGRRGAGERNRQRDEADQSQHQSDRSRTRHLQTLLHLHPQQQNRTL